MDETRRCSARSKQAGRRCKRAPIPGGTVCRMHGGAAPQVQQAARVRLAALVEPAIAQLERLLNSEHAAVSLGAAKDVLDRSGFKGPEKVEHSGGIEITWQTDSES